MQKIGKLNLNLKKLELEVIIGPLTSEFWNSVKLLKNAQKIAILDSQVDKNFIKNFGSSLRNFEQLEEISMEVNGWNDMIETHQNDVDEIMIADENFKWSLGKLKTLDICLKNCPEDINYLFAHGFQDLNLHLLHLCLSEFDFGHNPLENVLLKFPNLVELRVTGCQNHLSNALLAIMRYLKKLQILDYEFAHKNQFNDESFLPSKDFELPDIKKVCLFFDSDILNNQILEKFLKCIRNASEFSLVGLNCNVGRINMIIRELCKLDDLNFSCQADCILPENDITQIKDHIRKYHQNPDLISLRLCGINIDLS